MANTCRNRIDELDSDGNGEPSPQGQTVHINSNLNSRSLVLRTRCIDPVHAKQAHAFEASVSQEEQEHEDGDDEQRWLYSPNPREAVSSSNVDPFASLPLSLPASTIALLMDQTRSILLRQVTNRNPNALVPHHITKDMMHMTIQNRALFYSMIAAAMRFHRIARHETQIPQEEILAEKYSIELLCCEMASLDTALLETNITAIVALGYCGKTYDMRRGRVPRQSFLKELQDLNIYGRMIVVEAHVRGLSTLLSMLGGVSKLKTRGLAQLISFCDLFDCTRKLQQPTVPFVPYTLSFQRHYQNQTKSTDSTRHSTILKHLGSSFRDALISGNASESTTLQVRFINVAILLAKFTTFMNEFYHGNFFLANPVELTDYRNFVHHQLMSLPSIKKLHGDNIPDVYQCYELCRLACIAYNLLVVFPLPPTIGLFEPLARVLRLEAARLADRQKGFKESESKLMFWASMVGAIISLGLPQRQSFLDMLIESAGTLALASWQEAANVLLQFLWHPSTNNKDGQDVWQELSHVSSSMDETVFFAPD